MINTKGSLYPKDALNMLSKITVKNFRCFRDLKQGGLKRFNFIIGEGGSGKTALLEAIFLAGGGSPEIYFRIRGWRGFGDIRIVGTRRSFEAIFSDIFFENDPSQGAMISLEDSAVGIRTLRIYYSDQEPSTLPLRQTASTAPTAISPIHFKWKIGGREVDTRVFIEENTLKFSASSDVYQIHFITPQTIAPNVNAQNFSDLSKRNEQRKIVEAVQKVFPRVRDITTEVISGDAMLYALMDGISPKLPVAVLSGAMNKYLSIALAIASAPGGVVLIDEIENGFYYRDNEKILTSLAELCEDNNVQLVASTHSWELLTAVANVFGERWQESLCALRMVRSENKSAIEYIKGSAYKSAIAQGFEVR